MTHAASGKRRVYHCRMPAVFPIVADRPSSHADSRMCSPIRQSEDAEACRWRHRYRRGARIWDRGSRTTNDATHQSAPVRRSSHVGRVAEKPVSCVPGARPRFLPRSSIAAASPWRPRSGAARSASRAPASGRNPDSVRGSNPAPHCEIPRYGAGCSAVIVSWNKAGRAILVVGLQQPMNLTSTKAELFGCLDNAQASVTDLLDKFEAMQFFLRHGDHKGHDDSDRSWSRPG
ncbi:conserved hypothetical protein [Agrobacterium fabacearum TT111]|nr:conserved hypothetical protein [Agrobacterium fabacearum TT111]